MIYLLNFKIYKINVFRIANLFIQYPQIKNIQIDVNNKYKIYFILIDNFSGKDK